MVAPLRRRDLGPEEPMGHMTAQITAARATGANSRDIWTWRNDPDTRAMSISTDEISWEEHSRWYRDILADPNRYLYLGRLADNANVGICRFDVDTLKNVAHVSINLNPAMRGRNLSHVLLAAAIAAFWNEKNVSLLATIKQGNAASIRCFLKCGFELVTDDGEQTYYRLSTR